MPSSTSSTPILTIIEQITSKNQEIAAFWSKSHGWAPIEAAQLLSKSRLDRQVSLSRTLTLWVPPSASEAAPDIDGRLILGWANLGSLVEGSMKWFLSVFYDDYQKDIKAIRNKGAIIDPDGITLESIRQLYNNSVWTDSDDWAKFIGHVQSRRNTIHSYKDSELGTLDELECSIRKYRDLLNDLDGRVPYP